MSESQFNVHDQFYNAVCGTNCKIIRKIYPIHSLKRNSNFKKSEITLIKIFSTNNYFFQCDLPIIIRLQSC